MTSIFTILYARGQTKSAFAQVDILRKEAEKKKSYEQTSQALREATDIIKENSIDFGYADPIWIDQVDILSYIHDHQLSTLSFTINPVALEIHNKSDKTIKVKEASELIEVITGWLEIPIPCISGHLDFTSIPNILQNRNLDAGDIFNIIREYYSAYNKIKPHEYTIRFFDDSVLNDMKKIIDDMVKSLFENLTSKHEIVFFKSETSKEILEKLYQEWLGKKAIDELNNKLLKLCDSRLIEVQKDSFFKS